MADLPETRYSLLVRLRQQSNEAWSEFLQVYERAIYGFCRRHGLQDSDARDVKQEVLLAIHHQIEDWDPDRSKGSFRGWLFRVARNIAVNRFLDHQRRAARGDTQTRDLLAAIPDANAELETFEIEYQRSLMQWAAKKIKPTVAESSWLAFWSTAIEGRRPEQVAQELGMTIGSVYTAKCRVFAKIKSEIASLQHDDSVVDQKIESEGRP